MNDTKTTYDGEDEWRAEARRRFGDDEFDWRFVCPVCKHEQSVRDWFEAKAPWGAVAFSCVGRWLDDKGEAFGRYETNDGPCNYAGGGFFQLNPVTIEGRSTRVFAFADA